jgi:hypothetical protein
MLKPPPNKPLQQSAARRGDLSCFPARGTTPRALRLADARAFAGAAAAERQYRWAGSSSEQSGSKLRSAPPPQQLTIGQLRAAISGVADDVLVALVLPPGTPSDDRLTIILPAKIDYQGGPVFKLRPANSDEQSR